MTTSSFEYCGKPSPAFVSLVPSMYLSNGVLPETRRLIFGSISLSSQLVRRHIRERRLYASFPSLSTPPSIID